MTFAEIEAVKSEMHLWADQLFANAASTEPPPATAEELKDRVAILIDSRLHSVHWLDDDLLP